MRTVTLRLWQVSLIFLAVIVAAVVAASAWTSSHNAQVKANTALAERANDKASIALEIQRQIAARGLQTRKALRSQDVKSCASRHTLYIGIQKLIGRSLAQSEAFLAHPPAGVTRKQIQDSIDSMKRFERDLKKADCKGVPKLPPPVKIPRSPQAAQ